MPESTFAVTRVKAVAQINQTDRAGAMGGDVPALIREVRALLQMEGLAHA